jgi:hypothetical protein
VSFVGGGGGVRELVELIQSYVEARVEKCVSGNYALLRGDWACIVHLLVESGIVEKIPHAVLAPDPFTASDLFLRPKVNESDFVIVTPAPLLVAVRMGSPAYNSLVRTLSRILCCEGEERFEFLMVGRRRNECHVEMFMLRREPAWYTARELAKAVVEDMVGMVRSMVRMRMCRSERECLESALSYLKTARGCD